MPQRFLTFLKESRLELKKVTWPTRRETVRATLSVIVVSALFAVFLGALDYLFQLALQAVL
ncbi:MAG: preprotein translocase subunit SecE [Candidatus Sungbacteria bacterium]|nr:preprotein translocase subunit SecE [Candidatus Sungbacteria bacterium]